MLAILRIGGPALDVDESLRWLPSERVEAVWRRGEVHGSRGTPSATSGCNVRLADDEDVATCLRAAGDVLSRLAPPLRSLRAQGVGFEVDLSLEVGPVSPRSCRLPADFLNVMVEIGAELMVSAYPCSD